MKYMKLDKKKLLRKHLLTMQLELLHCYTVNHSSYRKNPHYFKGQIKMTKQKLKSFK
jgi:hypothetical protein